MRRVVWPLLFLCCFWLFPLQKAGATHIVGGELNYVKLTGDQYRVELKLYKDCGTSIVPFDDPALIYVYGGNDQFAFSFEIPIVERDTLEAIFQDTCLVVPSETCVDFARYETIVSLPANQQGYTLAFIRCCRTLAILNAEGIDEFGNPIPPDLIGATYTAKIPGGINNSNPEFREFPPIIVCSGQDIVVDHGAVDPDGDDLVYSLCTPYVGGSLTSVFGDPAVEFPPFEEIQWVEPYSLADLLGSEPVLSINPATGMLTGRAPDAIGQYVVGVCVREFRNGQFLSENKRDFQFNIADCGVLVNSDYNITGAISIDTIAVEEPEPGFEYILICDSVSAVQFHDLVDGTDSLLWDFDDGSPLSMEEDPYHVFPDTGFYLVSLFADPGMTCADTFTQLISIQYQNVDADFEFGPSECYNPQTGLQFHDLTIDGDAVDSWEWTFSDGGTSVNQDPVHFFNPDGIYDVSLEVVSRNGCKSRKDTQLNIIRLEEIILEDTVALCLGDSVLLELEIDGEHSFIWQPDGTLNDGSVQMPVAYPIGNTTYNVDVLTQTPSGTTCLQQDSVHVLTSYPVPVILDMTEALQCSEEVALSVEIGEGEQVIWANSPDFNEILSEEAEFDILQEDESATYYLMVENRYCSASDTVRVVQHTVNLNADGVEVCLGDETLLQVDAFSFNTDVIYTWSYPFPPYSTTDPFIVITPDDPVNVDVFAGNTSGCSDSVVVFVDVHAPLELNVEAEPQEVINSQEVLFNAENEAAAAYNWQPGIGFDDPSSSAPSATVSESTTFYVDVTDEFGCVWRDSITVTVVEIPCSESSIFIPNAFSPNGDGLNDVYRLRGTVIESLTLEIYDRWGNPVFRTNDITIPWDGRYEERPLSSGVFGYILRIECYGGNDIIKKGSITLIR